jgi:hypothetical protein
VPDDLAIYDTIAAAVAEVREPDLSSFDPSDVRTAMERVLVSPVPQRNFLTWLNGRVQQLSGGRVSIEAQAAPAVPPGPDTTPELPVRVVVKGESFAELAVVRADGPVVRFPMRG